ncbi:hypothetical protein TRIATDRAFT_40730 [Trichoderma atroviride IMI 206040]|uniref:Gfd2/YDR514C-like C-terminal domain-containing protein n=1 Tax=Hypocrea atroviridis (strain ATCC 20476 / IMI 206040) TaxID=452589 RepID=G9NUB4_HYPAI|nr:uncharacterized protein TRIATDRAFT_40730 [Trichoderma atroviride IMI 206040]EHK45647.1 hypothetical protein TRIATDRAFT_40730 [Trichoderma atroviride IMI 206040]
MQEDQALAEPERRVSLREETIVLRWLFGYLDKRNLPGWTKPLRWPHTLSTWLPKKPKTRFREATLLGIDIDGIKEQDGMPVQFHIGISILHTTDLHNLCHDPLPFKESHANIIRSFHWVVQDPNYFNKHDNRFCFGKYKCIPLSSLEECLKKLLRPHYPLILVVHGISLERIVLQKLNIRLNPIFTIDTTKAARYPLQELHDSTLKKLLQDFNIPFTGGLLHFAGNDAHFALRALLMIAVRDARRELDDTPAWVSVFEAVAQAPLPPRPLTRQERVAIQRRKMKDLKQLEEKRARD